jgi:hypothetical protein
LSRVPRNRFAPSGTTILRASSTKTGACVAGLFSAVFTPSVSTLAEYSDLENSFELYRIRSMTLHLMLGASPANSGIVNISNARATVCCDHSNSIASPTQTQIAAYANAKSVFLTAEKPLIYRFTPRPATSLAGGSVGLDSGWLYATGTGFGITHNALYLTVDVVNSSSTQSVIYWFDFELELRGMT